MSDVKGYYSVVQYCPDLKRGEAANVGVVLFCPEPHGIWVRVSDSLARVRQFFRPDEDELLRIADCVNAVKTRLSHRASEFRTAEDLQDYADSMGNNVRLTSPRVVRVADAPADLLRLYMELIDDDAMPRRTRRVAASVADAPN